VAGRGRGNKSFLKGYLEEGNRKPHLSRDPVGRPKKANAQSFNVRGGKESKSRRKECISDPANGTNRSFESKLRFAVLSNCGGLDATENAKRTSCTHRGSDRVGKRGGKLPSCTQSPDVETRMVLQKKK